MDPQQQVEIGDHKLAAADETEKARAQSPSALSTVSSNSPLVRNNSSSSSTSSGQREHQRHISRRCALPTSIAAAQLQSNHLEFVNKTNGAANSGTSKKSQNGLAAKLVPTTATAANNNSEQSANKRPHSLGPAGKKKLADNQKSLGYNVAKSVAFRVNKFGEFWSVNKMRYMNLACLLMTLVCLVTILLFSHSDHHNGTHHRHHHQQLHQTSGQVTPKHRRGEHSAGEPADNLAVESIDSLDKQAFARDKPLSGADDQNPTATDSSSSDNNAAKAKNDFGMFDDDNAEKSKDDKNETEQEQTMPGGKSRPIPFLFDRTRAAGTSSFLDPILSQVFDDLNSGLGALIAKSTRNGTTTKSIINAPIIRRSKNGATIIFSGSTSAAGGGSLFGDLLGNRTSSPNSTSNDFVALPSLIERLLPPMLRPLSMMGDSSSSGASGTIMRTKLPNGFATITINSEPIVSNLSILEASESMGPPSPFNPFDRLANDNPFAFISSPFDSAFPSNHHHHHHHHNPFRSLSSASSLVMPMPMSMSPFLPPPPRQLFPPPGLLGMLMRSASEQLSPSPLGPSGRTTNSQSSSSAAGSGNSPSDDVKLSAQASQQTNQTATALNGNSTTTTTTTNSTTNDNEEDEDVELFNVNQRPSPSSKPSVGSMIVISSSSSSFPPPALLSPQGPSDLVSIGSNALPFSPAVGDLGHHHHHHYPGMEQPPASVFSPQMFMFGQNAGESDFPPAGRSAIAMNPILRALMGNMMSELTSASDESTGSGYRLRDNSRGPFAMPNNRMWPVDDLARGESPFPRTLRNKQTNSNQDSDQNSGLSQRSSSPLASFSSLVGGFADQRPANSLIDDLNDEPKSGAASSASSSVPTFVSGTIRQTFRRPGVTLERVIELPTSRHSSTQSQIERQQQLGANPLDGIKSQSISRIDSSASNRLDEQKQESSGGSKQLRGHMFPPRLFGGFATSRDATGASEAVPPFGLIGNLFDDLRGASLNGRGGFVVSSAPGVRESRFDPESDDLDEGDSVQTDEIPSRAAADWPPKIRLASARIRIKNPMFGSQRRQDSMGPFMPPARFSFPAMELPNGPDEQEEREEATNEGQSQFGSGNNNRQPIGEATSGQATLDDLNNAINKARSEVQSIFSNDNEQHSRATKVSASRPESVYTSPTSPLFGFPSMAANQLQREHNLGDPSDKNDEESNSFAKIQATKKTTSGVDNLAEPNQAKETGGHSSSSTPSAGTHRRQRAFVYHSNHEVAGSLMPPPPPAVARVQGRADDGDHFQAEQSTSINDDPSHQQQQAGEAIDRPRFILPPPAAVVMGRRLDDGPFAAMEQQQEEN